MSVRRWARALPLLRSFLSNGRLVSIDEQTIAFATAIAARASFANKPVPWQGSHGAGIFLFMLITLEGEGRSYQ